MKIFVTLFLLTISLFSKADSYQAQAKRVTIHRDEWGIPHIYGKTDADAVFGLMYAQCEDDFARVEMNYIEKLGRMSEVKGEKELAYDLYIKLLIDEKEAKAEYKTSPVWLKKLLNAYADGINYYLQKHPEVKPRLITHFEPWFPLLWTDGSIGAISTGDVTEQETALFYGLPVQVASVKYQTPDEKLTGSNGFAVGPALSKSGHSLLYINPHVTFYFRPEVHVESEEGLSVYGAVTWGQFFVYQGFNPYNGWMHTSSEVDVADAYVETTRSRNGRVEYLLDGKWIPFQTKIITLGSRKIKAYFNHRGPVLAARNGKWISVRSYNRARKSLMQSWLRTKTKGLADYKRVMDMRANTSNNTVYADNKGNIAYWHGNYVPRRDSSKDWGVPQDGSSSKIDWKGLHSVEEIVHVYNPTSGWIQNCNSTPFTVSGTSSPLRANYPVYMAPDGENFRDRNAVRLFSQTGKLDLQGLIGLGYDRRLMAFETLVPALIDAAGHESDLSEVVQELKKWDYNASSSSIAQTIAIRWGLKIMPKIPKPKQFGGETEVVQNMEDYAKTGAKSEMVQALREVLAELNRDFGTWRVAWGELNRFQRISNGDALQMDDSKASFPVPFTSSAWGQLPSYTSRSIQGSKKWYGVNGNSFIAAVEFGPKIKAYSLLAGGQNGSPNSPHFFDQGQMYAEGKFKDIYFYKSDVLKHAVASYHP
ncbi:penicillin acylase family protein [Aquirufa lenticrescens]|uniref:penicillin acylase family protein n=1 Tax=Aquirufa lenticrescens TaxID=2696560 RepID=UPI001CAA62B4|nr:penicillin acylase family protein [Aquirufa lenticrescens]UAJ14848.1 penicillin acylase family protein [Aquirufa lenticrescens]